VLDEPAPDSLLEVEEREDPLREVSSPNLTVLREVSLGMVPGRGLIVWIWAGRLLVSGLAAWARRRCRNTAGIQHVFFVDLARYRRKLHECPI
jgi:hypothetical protein